MATGDWKIIRSSCVDTDYGSADDLALTGIDGKFYLSVWTRHPPDSLAVGVVSPDSLILGELTLRPDLNYSTIEKTGSYEEAGSGCDSGTTVETSYVSAYAYRMVEGVTITVPK